MAFNSKGYLEPGLHEMRIDKIEEEFVAPFPHSSTRRLIIDGFKKHTDEIKKVVNNYVQLIDGSFVTNKNDPGDIDLVCFIDGDMLDALPSIEQQKIQKLMAGPASKAVYMCDAYFCASYPSTHPKHNSYRSVRKYWMGEFGYDRTDVPKGIVVVKEVPPSPPPAAAAIPATPGPGAGP